MTEHKNQHFIPVSYLKAWCDSNTPPNYTPYVWTFTKDGKTCKNKAPVNIFKENNMYTINCTEVGRKLVLEKGLSELEGRFAKLRRDKLNRGKKLTDEDKFLLCVFMSALQSRTRVYRTHLREQWGKALKMMEIMKEWAKTATPEQKRAMARSTNNSNLTLSYNDIKELYENPLQNSVPSIIETVSPLFFVLDLAILRTNDGVGFITSDNPCLWFDPESHKRLPLYQQPALVYKTVEITMPISPNQLVFLNRQGINGYIGTKQPIVDELNRRIRFYANEYIIVNKKKLKQYWFQNKKPQHPGSISNSSSKLAFF